MTSLAALPADRLVDSFGVRTIFAERSGGAYGGWTNPSTVGNGDITPIVDAMVDLGVRHVREGIRAASSTVVTGTSATNQKNAFIELAAAGIKVMSSFGTATGDPAITTYLNWVLANFGTPTDVFEYFEGPNEPNPSSPPAGWADDVAARVKELHTQVRTNGTYAALSSIGLVNSSIQGGATPHGEFQAAAAAIGGGVAAENFLDYANYHVYPGQANGGTDTSKPSWQIDTRNGNAQNDAPGKGVMCTESGMFDTVDPATPAFTYHPIDVQNVYIPRMLLEHIYRGEARHYWFEFLDDHDPSSTDKEDHFGLIEYGSTYPVKDTYTTMKYLFDLTADPGYLNYSPNALTLNTSGSAPSDFRQLLFKKHGTGKHYLCMWRDVSIWNLDTSALTTVTPVSLTIGLDTAKRVVLHNPSRQEATSLGTVSSFAVNTAPGLSGLRGEVIVAEIG